MDDESPDQKDDSPSPVKNDWRVSHSATITPYQCEFCSKKFGDKINLSRHVEIWHDDVRERDNEEEDKGGDSSSVSENEDNKQNQFKDVSKPGTPQLHTEKFDREYIETDGSPQFCCSQCDLKFYRQANLDVHLMTHRPKPPSKKKRLSTKFTKKKKKPSGNHLAIKGEFPCQYCSKVYNYHFNATRHEKTCQENPGQELQKSIENPGALRAAEDGEGNNCEFCATSCSSRSSRRQHEKFCSKNPENSKSTGETISSSVVDNGTVERNADDSSNTTVVEKVISCQYCSKVFSLNSSRRRHEVERCPSGPEAKNQIETPPLSVKSTESGSSSKLLSSINCRFCSKTFTSRFAAAQHVKHECKQNPASQKLKTKEKKTEPKGGELGFEESTMIDGKTCRFCAKTFTKSSSRKKHEIMSCLSNPESQISQKKSANEDDEEPEEPENVEDLINSNDSNDSLVKAANGMTCPYCSKDFSSRGNRRRHERICPDNPSSTATSKNAEINSDEDDSDGEEMNYDKDKTCQFCSKVFSVISNRKLHEKICFGNPNRSDPRDNLKENSQILENPNSLSITSSNRLTCKYCSNVYTHGSNRRRHEKKCAKNPLSGSSASADKDPESKEHRTCQYCSKIFSLVSYKNLHEKICSAKSTKPDQLYDNSRLSSHVNSSSPSLPISENSKTRPCKHCGRQISRSNIWRHEKHCSLNPSGGKIVEKDAGNEESQEASDDSSQSDDYFVPVQIHSTPLTHKVGPKSKTTSSLKSEPEKKKPIRQGPVKIKIGPASFKKKIESENSRSPAPVSQKRAGPLCSKSKEKNKSSGRTKLGNKPVVRKGVSLPDSTKPIQLTWKGVQIFFPTVTIEKNIRDKAEEALRQKEIVVTASSAPNNDTETTQSSLIHNEELECGSSSPGPKWKIKSSTSLAVSSSSSKLLACKICGIKYKNTSALDRHMLVHLDVDSVGRKCGPCTKCGAKFTKNRYLTEHRKLCRANTASLVSVIENQETPDSEDKLLSTDKIKIESTIEVHDFEYSVKLEQDPETIEHVETSIENYQRQGKKHRDYPVDSDYELDAEELISSDGSEMEVDSDEESPKTTRRATRSAKNLKNRKLSANVTKSSSQQKPINPSSSASIDALVSNIIDEQYTHCGVCLIKLTDEVAVIKHSKEHTKSESQKPAGSTFECMVCLKKFSTFPHFEQHMYWRHVKVAPVFKCEECPETFPSKLRLMEHSTTHANDNSKVNESSSLIPSTSYESFSKTGTCKSFTRQTRTMTATSLLSGQNKSAQRGNDPVEKEDRGIAVKSLDNANTTTKTTPMLYVCQYKDCQHFFSHDEDLWYHVEKKHKCFNDLCCSQCGQDFPSIDLLKIHVQTNHHLKKPSADRLIHTTTTNVSITHSGKSNSGVVEDRKKISEEPEFDGYGDDYAADDMMHDLGNESDGPDVSLFIPETTLVVERRRNPYPDPYVKITADLKAAADFYLQKNPHLIVCRTKKDRQGKYLCDICGNRSFWKRPSYVAHMRYHRQLLTAGVFRDLKKRDKLKRIQIPLDRTCRICSRRLESDASYRSHVQYHRTQKKRYGHYWVPGTKRQESQIPIQDVYRCNICPDREFTNRSNYFSHMTYHRIKEQKTGSPLFSVTRGKFFGKDVPIQDVYTCEYCPERKFTSRGHYFSHMKYHRIKEQKTGSPVHCVTRGKGLREDVPIQDVYRCNICPNREFTNRSNYFSHMTYHRVKEQKTGSPLYVPKSTAIQRVYTCEFCPERKFTGRAHYSSHMTYHKIKEQKTGSPIYSGKRGGKAAREDIPYQDEYTCELCPGRKFTKRNLFIIHTDYHKKFAPDRRVGRLREDVPFQDEYTCDQCNNKKFDTRNAYLCHVRNYHEEERPDFQKKLSRPDIPVQDTYVCQYCKDRVFPNRMSYISHHDYHVKTGNFGPLMRPPTRKITPADVPVQDEYSCEKCNGTRKFSDRAKYVLHMNYHDVLERRKKNQEALQKNPNQSVSGVFRCKICPDFKTFTDSSKFRIHMQYHKFKDRTPAQPSASASDSVGESSGEKFSCLKCGEEKIFTSRQLFMEHLKEHKLAEKASYKCSLCEKAYTSSWILSEHMKTHDDKRYTCGDCGMKFQYSFSLRRHQENSCKRVQCKFECHCGNKYPNRKELNIHIKKEHSTNKVDVNSLVQQSSDSLTTLTWSMCYVCKKRLPSSSQLNDHVQVCHPEVYTDFIKDKVSKISAEVLAYQSNLGRNTEAVAQPDFINVDRNRVNYEDLPLEPQVVLEEGEDMFQPQVVLDEGDCTIPQVEDEESLGTAHEDLNNEVIVLDDDDQDIKQENNEEDGSTPQWQVFKGLESLGETSDNDDDYDDYQAESFEPEDVEVEGIAGDPFKSGSPVKTSSPKPNEISSQYNGQLSSVKPTLPTQTRRKPTPSGPLRYSCCHCTKRTVEPKYMHIHWRWHHQKLGLPFKYVDITSGETICPPPDHPFQRPPKNHRPQYQTYQRVQNKTVPMVVPHQSASSMDQSQQGNDTVAKPTRFPTPPTQDETEDSTCKQTEASSVVQEKGSVVQKPLKKPGPKSRTMRVQSKVECACVVSNTALAQLKRCVGTECACYTSNKGCSTDCTCAKTCSNPYALRSSPTKSVPDLMPMDVIQTVSESTARSEGTVSATKSSNSEAETRTKFTESISSSTTRDNPTNLRDAMNKLIEKSVCSKDPSPAPSSSNQTNQSPLGRLLSSSSPIPQVVRTPTPPQQAYPYQNNSTSMQACLQSQLVSPARFNYTHGQPVHSRTIPHYTPTVPVNPYSNPSYSMVAPVIPYTQSQTSHQNSYQNTQSSTSYSQQSSSIATQPGPLPPSYTYNPQFYGANTQSYGASSISNNYGSGSTTFPTQSYKCAHCTHSASCYSSYIGHQWEHRDKTQFLCPICILWYNSVPELAEHARAHSNSSSQTSGAVPQLPPALPHLPQISPSPDIVQCFATSCPSRFKTADEANRHFQLFHQQLVCRVCQAFLPSDHAMKDHINQHYYCYTCGERFLLYATLQEHMFDAHNIEHQR